MRNIFFATSFTILFFSVSIFSQAVPVNNDFQIWNETSITFPILKSKNKEGKEFDRLTFSINGTLRFSRNNSALYDKRIGVGFSYRLNKYVSFTPDYLYRSTQPYRSDSQFEHRLRFAVTPENKWKKFALINRNQIEYRIRHSRPNTVRYKNRLRFEYPLTKNKKEFFTPFASNEVFYDLSENRFTRNELFVGVNKKFNKNFSADFFYLLVKDTSSPKTINGFGISLKFKAN